MTCAPFSLLSLFMTHDFYRAYITGFPTSWFEHCEACPAPCGGGTVTRSMRRVANATLLRFDRYDEPPVDQHAHKTTSATRRGQAANGRRHGSGRRREPLDAKKMPNKKKPNR